MDETALKSMATGGEEHQTAIIDNVRIELAMAKSQVCVHIVLHYSLLCCAISDIHICLETNVDMM